MEHARYEVVPCAVVVNFKGTLPHPCDTKWFQEGRHEVRVRAVDAAGNADPSPATFSWIVDGAGVYGHPSMVTDVIAEGGNEQVRVHQFSGSCVVTVHATLLVVINTLN